MITGFKVKYHPATNSNGARFTVTRLDDKLTYRVAYDYAAISAERTAINIAFGVEPNSLECIGRLTRDTAIFAVHF